MGGEGLRLMAQPSGLRGSGAERLRSLGLRNLGLAAAAVCALVLVSCWSSSQRVELAYDGIYDTPPVTWYYGGPTSSQNTLGYTWNNAIMQQPSVTYEPGVMTDTGIAHTTADTIGFDTGPTNSNYPLGYGGETGNVIYQSYKGKPVQLKAERAMGVKAARLQQLKEWAVDKEISKLFPEHDVTKMKETGGKGGKDALTKQLDKTFAGAKRGRTHKLQDVDINSIKNELNAIKADDQKTLSTASKGPKTSSKAPSSPVLAAQPPAQRPQQQLRDLTTSAMTIPEDQNPSLGLVTGGHNIWGPGYVNEAGSDATQNNWQANSVYYQSPAAVLNPAVPPPVVPSVGYAVHVKAWGWQPEVDGEDWDYARHTKKGPKHWGMLKGAWGVCYNGHNQSPINVELNVKRNDHLEPLAWKGPTAPYEAVLVSPLYKNLLEVQKLKGTMTLDNVDFRMKSMTIHTPSEHRFQGRQFDGELQFLHRGDNGVTMIVSGFLTVGPATAPSLANLINAVTWFEGTYNMDATYQYSAYTPPRYKEDIKPYFWFSTSQVAEDFLGTGMNYANYYSYYGSLTRPPCTEGVTWILLKNPLSISAADHAALLEIQGHTARPTQQLHNREVYDTGTGRSNGFQSPTRPSIDF